MFYRDRVSEEGKLFLICPCDCFFVFHTTCYEGGMEGGMFFLNLFSYFCFLCICISIQLIRGERFWNISEFVFVCFKPLVRRREFLKRSKLSFDKPGSEWSASYSRTFKTPSPNTLREEINGKTTFSFGHCPNQDLKVTWGEGGREEGDILTT